MNPYMSKNIKIVFAMIFTFGAGLYLFAGAILHFKLSTLGTEALNLSETSSVCDGQICTGKWSFVTDKKFILLGQILRNHKLFDTSTGAELLPISAVNSTNTDSWIELHVYQINPGVTYQITAQKPSSAKLDYFVGILPRATDNPGILSGPEIIRSLSVIGFTMTLLAFGILIGAMFVSNTQFTSSTLPTKTSPGLFIFSALLLTLGLSMSAGLWDSVFPEGNIRNFILRSTVTASFLILLFQKTLITLSNNSRIILTINIGCVLTLTGSLWPFLRQAHFWSLTIGIISILGALRFFTRKEAISGLLWGSGLFDSLRIFGVFSLPDYPPFFAFNVLSLVALGLSAGNSGGFATIYLAGKAYRRLRREVALDAISHAFHSAKTLSPSDRIQFFSNFLPVVSEFLQAERVSITINLPLGRPITHLYDRAKKIKSTFDDGTISGVVSMRTLLYGETALFESFATFSKRHGLSGSSSLADSDLFCTIPIRVNGMIVGALMVTRFDDRRLRDRLGDLNKLDEDKANINAVIAAVESMASSLIVQTLNDSAQASRRLHSDLHQELAVCDKPADFLSLYARIVAFHCKCAVFIHAEIAEQGIAVAHCSVPIEAWRFLTENPLNLNPNNTSPIGPTVVAFREGRSSYVKDIREIKKHMHPKTQSLFELMGTETLAAVRLGSEGRRYVVTMFTNAGDPPPNAAITQIIESTEAIFVAALEIMSQRSSVVALGELTSRLIGDHEIRAKIIEAAKARNLPTTIGRPKSSFLLLFDLAGSSDLSQDTELKARAYGTFYDLVNKKSQELLNGTIRKTIGDAVIVTWDGTQSDPSADPNFVQKLQSLAAYADCIAREIGCKGARALLHHGKYFLGLVGTETFGQIDVIGSGIDEVCKMEGTMKQITIDGKPAKLAISGCAINQFSSQTSSIYVAKNLTAVGPFNASTYSIHYACTLTNSDRMITHVAG